MPRWKNGTPAALALISPTRSIRATVRQLASCSRCGRSVISVIIPTMTDAPLITPRNLPTVERSGRRARRQPDRGLRAADRNHAAEAFAGGACGGGAGGSGLASVILSFRKRPVHAEARHPHSLAVYRTILDFSLSLGLFVKLKIRFAHKPSLTMQARELSQ